MPFGNDPPAGLYTGLRAMTVQSYTEANVKNGSQFEFSSPRATLAAGATVAASLQTGIYPVLVKSRVIQFTGKGVTARLYEGGSIVADSGTETFIYNLKRSSPITATLCRARTGVTVSSLGLECGAPTVGIGSTGQGQSVIGAFQVQGVERQLAPNSTYLLQIKNDGPDPCDVSVYATFYEGDPDLPLP